MEKLKNLVVLIAGLFALKQLFEKDRHVQSLVTSLAALSTSEHVIAGQTVQWVGIIEGFTGGSASAWYSWLVATTIASVAFSLILLVYHLVSWRDEVLDISAFSAGAGIGLAISSVGAKISWLLLAHATILSVLSGVVLAVIVMGFLGRVFDAARV